MSYVFGQLRIYFPSPSVRVNCHGDKKNQVLASNMTEKQCICIFFLKYMKLIHRACRLQPRNFLPWRAIIAY